jgi:hypothetical protein
MLRESLWLLRRHQLTIVRTRAYRMKLEEWGMRKNKGAANIGKKVRPSPSGNAIARNRSTLERGSSHMVSALPTDGNSAT